MLEGSGRAIARHLARVGDILHFVQSRSLELLLTMQFRGGMFDKPGYSG